MPDHHEIQPSPRPVPQPARSAAHLSPVRPVEISSVPDAFGLLKALGRRWPQALGLAVVLTAVTAGLAFLLLPPSKYTARATFQISSVPPKVIFKTSDNENQNAGEFESFKKTQADLMKSRRVLEGALNGGKLESTNEEWAGIAKLSCVLKEEDPVEWLEKTLQVEKQEGSEIVRLSISGDDPNEAAKVVNAVALSYVNIVIEGAKTNRVKRYEMLKDLWGDYQANLKDKKKTLEKLAEIAGSKDQGTLVLKQQFQLERLDAAEKELMHTQTEVRRLQLEADLLKKHQTRQAQQGRGDTPVNEVDEAVLEAEAAQDMGLKQHAQMVALKKEKLRKNSRFARSQSDPSITTAQRDYNDAVKDMETYKQQLMASLADRVRRGQALPGDRRTIGDDPALLEERIAGLKGLEKQYEEDVKRLTEATKAVGQNANELASEQEEIAHAEEAAKKVGAEVEALHVEMKSGDRVTLFEKAAVPRVKDSKRIIMLSAAAALVFLSSLVGVSWMEYRARRIDTIGEVVNGLGIRLVGTLPALPRPDRGGPLSRRPEPNRKRLWQNLLVESIDAARTALLHLSRVESVRALVITSATGGEGKTTLSSQIATSLARAGRRTLLVDCDLRRPSLHRVFDVEQGPGFCELLRGERDIESIIQPLPTPDLWLLPAGECNSQTIELLAQDGLRVIFEELRERFDFVIIDSSPVLPVADVVLIGQQADAALFSILRNVSRAPNVQQAYDRLSAFGIRTLGAVVTGIDEATVTPYGSQDRYLSRESV
jgi:capsular exopolysaccharide synthesis family protein